MGSRSGMYIPLYCTCILMYLYLVIGQNSLYPTRLLHIKLFCPVTGFLAIGASIDVITLWINKGEIQD
jgi:hypothetical protein